MTTARTLCRRISGVALCLGLVVGVLGGAAAMFYRTGSAAAAASQPAAPASLYADIDGDGLADAITIEVGFDAASPRTGLVTVNSGATGQTLYTIAGETANDRFGYAVTVADLDGDGARELILTAPGAQAAGGSGAGRLYIYSASSGQLARSISADVGLRIGLNVRTLADQDGDGWGELAVEGGRLEGSLWRASSLVYSGGNGRLLAARDATAGGISRYVEDGGRAYVAADLDDSGIVDVQDVTLMASGLAGAGGPELDVNRDGTVDSADLAAVAESLLRGDRSMVASGLVTEVAGEADAIAAGWAEVHSDTELSLSWSQITHNAQSDEGSGDSSMLGGGGGHGTGPPRTGRIPCDCPGIGPDTAGGSHFRCPGFIEGCPGSSVLIGSTFLYTMGGPNCEISIEGDLYALVHISDGEGGSITFNQPGCVIISMLCFNPDGTCCACSACRVCAYPEPPCEAEVGFVNCPTEDDLPFPKDALNTLVFEAVGLPESDYVDDFLTPGVYDWAIQVSNCTDPCSGFCPDCPAGCMTNYAMTTREGGMRLGDHPSFATLDLTDAQCLWVRVRYRFAEKEDCDPAICCEIPTQCCHAVATCKVALYDRDDDLDSDGDGYCDREEAQSDPDSGGRPIDRLIDRDLDGINRPRDVRGPTEYELLLPHDNPPWRALPYRERFDTDKDGLQDLAELRVGLSPELRFTTAGEPDRYTPAGLAADRDQDLVDDVFEMAAGLDTTVRDTDGDGIVDGIELRGGTDPAVSHRHESADTDGDGLSDYEEVRFYWTDRDHTDTDGDGLNDFFEVRAGLNPRSPYSDSRRVLVNGLGGSELRVELGPHDGVADSDFDGLNNALEQYWGTDPTYRDSDGDGVSDIEELLGGTSPTDPNDGGVPLPNDDLCFMLVSIGGRFDHPTLGCVENGGEGADPRPEGGGSGLGPGVGGMGDDKPTTDWTITIGGDLNGDGDLDDPGEQHFPPIQTGPGGTRTTVLLALERGRCYTINLGGRRRPEYHNAHDSWWFQMIPVDPRVVVDGRPQICADCCCVTVDQSPGTGAIGNYCQRSVGGSTMTATVCLPLVDLDIGIEESMEEQSSVGRLLTIHNGDSDGDFVPDFADGFDLNGQPGDLDDVIEHPLAAASMTPVVLEIAGLPDPDSAQVRFQYSGSDPAGVTVTPAPEGGPHTYALPASGKLRLWRKAANEPRLLNALGGVSSPTGDYVVPNHLYSLADLGIPAGGRLTLWAEAVAPSESLKDISIEVEVVGECSDTAYATAIGTQYRVVMEENGQMQLGAAVPFPPLSAPSPVIDITSNVVSNVRATVDYRGLLVDISLSGAVDDAVTDLIRDGTIDRLDVYINDQPIEIDGTFPGWIPVQTVQKLGAGDPAFVPTSVIRPFDYQGAFSAALSNVEVGPGWNTLKLIGTNARGFPGYAEFAFEVVTEAPPDQELVATFDFHGLAPTEEPPPGPPPVLTMAVVSNGAGFGPFDLERVAPGRYEFDTLVVEVLDAANAQLDPAQPDVWILSVTHTDSLFHGTQVIAIETGDDTGAFAFVGGLTESERTSLVGWSISLGETRPVLRSDGGIFIPTVAELVGPVSLATADSFTAAMVIGTNELVTYEVNRYGDDLLLAETSDFPPAVFIAALSVPQGRSGPEDEVPPDHELRTGAYWALVGFKDGLGVSAVQWWQGSVDLADTLIEQSAYWGWYVYWVYGDETAEMLDQKNRRQITQSVQGVQLFIEYAPVVHDIITDIIAGDEAVITAIFMGNLDALNRFDEKERIVVEIAAMLFVELRSELEDLDSYDAGWVSGRIMGEVGIQVGGAALSGGLSSVNAATTMGSVSARLGPLLGTVTRFAPVGSKLTATAAAATGGLRIAARFGKKCERLTANRLRFQRDLGLDEWPAFQRVVDEVRLHGVRTKKDATALLGATHLTFKDLYERLTAGPTIDLTKFPTYNQFRQTMHGLQAQSDIEGHHIAVKDLMRRIGEARGPGRVLTLAEEATLDDMPVFPLWKHWHRETGEFVNPPKSFHEILDEVLAIQPPASSTLALKARLREAYRRFNELHGESAEFDYAKVGQVADAWIDAWLTAHP